MVITPAARDFLEALNPVTVLGRLQGTRRGVFNAPMPRQNAAGVVGWVGEGAPKPVGELSFDAVTLAPLKYAGIVTFTAELLRRATPDVEQIVRQELLAAASLFADQALLDPTVSGTPDIVPASITNGATTYDSSGTTAAAIDADLKKMLGALVTARASFVRPYWIMTG